MKFLHILRDAFERVDPIDWDWLGLLALIFLCLALVVMVMGRTL